MKRVRRRHGTATLVPALLAAALAGCAVGPDYERPAVDVPAAYRFAQPGEVAPMAIEPRWWGQFHDPVLDALIMQALERNRDILIAVARVEEYYGRVMSTRGLLFPQVGVEALAGRQRIGEGGAAVLPGNNPFNQVQADVFASWEIDLFGRLRRLTESARAQWAASDEARRAVEISVVAAVASAYITLRDLDNRRLVAIDTLSTREGALKLFRDRFEGGVVGEVEVAQAQSEYSSAQGTVALYELLVAQQENLLSVLVGDNPRDMPRGLAIGELASPVIPAGLPSELLAQRPDLLQAEQQLIAANAEIGAARAQYFPAITLTGLFGAASTALSGLWGGAAKTWSYGASVAMPIFTGGRIAGDVKQAEARQRQALQAYQQAIQTAFREVADALVGVQRTRDQLAAKNAQVDALVRYVALAQDRYEGGYTSYLEVLDAERSLFAAQLDQSNLRGTEFGQIVQLYKALGAGWPMRQDTTMLTTTER
ncbi:efflux transporter outer membrane subunit [Cupriavidus respiraculi]|uniref:efflux transporter outer membrane subunit n=1 Tax=Cupriavidus respiraculi TaxID=195930 RepID=UPI001EE9DE80|nr:efflux transporter outer membrane subunit [Cupriavidus respiraculi]